MVPGNERIRRRRVRRIRRRQALIAGAGALLSLAITAYRHWHRSAPSVKPAPPLPPPILPPALPDPPGILLHHSNTPSRIGKRIINAATLDDIHREDHPDWAIRYEGKTYYIGYHYVILPDGKVEKGRPDHCHGAHCPKFNNWLGICLVGAFSTIDNPRWWPPVPTRSQMASLIKLCQELMSQYHIPPENVRRHRDVRQTWCPGGRFPYARIRAELENYAAGHPETRLARSFPIPNPNDTKGHH